MRCGLHVTKQTKALTLGARYGGAKAPLRREVWPPRYETDQGVDSRRQETVCTRFKLEFLIFDKMKGVWELLEGLIP
nr:hypothetical protein [Tanacetum cinerariifolium]